VLVGSGGTTPALIGSAKTLGAPGIVAGASTSDGVAARSRLEELARRGLYFLVPRPPVVRFDAAGNVSNRKTNAWSLDTVASSGFRPSRAVCSRLRP
jgi:hypothetical protein